MEKGHSVVRSLSAPACIAAKICMSNRPDAREYEYSLLCAVFHHLISWACWAEMRARPYVLVSRHRMSSSRQTSHTDTMSAFANTIHHPVCGSGLIELLRWCPFTVYGRTHDRRSANLWPISAERTRRLAQRPCVKALNLSEHSVHIVES